MTNPRTDITTVLSLAAKGDREAGDRLWGLVYDELRRMARRELARRDGGGTLSTTGLVHEAYFKLAEPAQLGAQDRNHFYGLACRAMRQILVDRARYHAARKRGAGAHPASLDRAEPAAATRSEELLDLDEALTKLTAFNERLGRIVECRFFGGLSFQETADVLGISLRTAERDWGRAKAYLYRWLSPAPEQPA